MTIYQELCLTTNWHWQTWEQHHTQQTQYLTHHLRNAHNIVHKCSNLPRQAGFQSLHVSSFKHFLTLFSKSFSLFPHGTCPLSVSNQCEIANDIYHYICNPILRKVTRWEQAINGGQQMTNRTLTFTSTLFQKSLHLHLHWLHVTRQQFKATGPNFHPEHVHVHSPLLKES